MGTASYELVFINDGSRDESLDVLRRLAREDPEVVVLSFPQNFGQHPAISGIRPQSRCPRQAARARARRADRWQARRPR